MTTSFMPAMPIRSSSTSALPAAWATIRITVFKVYVDGALYDIIDGGRYDQLSSRFGVDRSACGFGMNINLLYEYMNDAGILEDTEPSFQLAVSYTTSDQR